MNKLQQAISLSQKAQNYISQGNYQFAVRCYDKMILLLKNALNEASSKQTIESIQSKIKKYIELKMKAEKQQKKKEGITSKIVKFGFPQTKNNQIPFVMMPTKQFQVQQKKQQEEDPIATIRKGQSQQKTRNITRNNRKKTQIDPSIQNLIIRKLDINFNDVVGMKEAKLLLEEAVIRPRQRPDLYTGIRAPPRGLLLYGPPGNGKTYICKALAKECNCIFFALSASSIMNKFVGESEKMLKKIFLAAEELAPSIIFIDEIDSMLTARSQNENEASRRLKTQFLILMDGISSPEKGQVLVIGATNLPGELDSAAKRRFSKLIYIGHPDAESREEMLIRNLKEIEYDLSKSDIKKIVQKMEYYSASEINNIIAEVCMIPLREVQKGQFQRISKNQLRKVNYKDFTVVLNDRKPIIPKSELEKYKKKI